MQKIRKLLENRMFIQILPIVFLLILILFFSLATERFASKATFKVILDAALPVGVVATGACFIFATGNVNLAMGATTVLTATLAGMAYNATESLLVMIIVAILLGMGLMAVSAVLSTLFQVRVLFVTIVMMTLLSAIQQSILGGTTVSLPYALVDSLTKNYFAYYVFAFFFLACVVLFHFSNIGRSLKMLGTNDVNAEQTGIRKSIFLLIAFIIAGIGCGCGALVFLVRSGSVGTKTLPSLNMDCMLAIVLGGMSVFGGSKSFVYSGIVGAITVCVLNTGLQMIGVDSTIIQAVRGALFLLLIMTAQQRPKGLPAPEG
ncbi:MAG: ABC transporter permease [Lachnospiraceae bacterium]|nr:ABC transporter permease [Lachnospiraceae bacterium]